MAFLPKQRDIAIDPLTVVRIVFRIYLQSRGTRKDTCILCEPKTVHLTGLTSDYRAVNGNKWREAQSTTFHCKQCGAGSTPSAGTARFRRVNPGTMMTSRPPLAMIPGAVPRKVQAATRQQRRESYGSGTRSSTTHSPSGIASDRHCRSSISLAGALCQRMTGKCCSVSVPL